MEAIACLWMAMVVVGVLLLLMWISQFIVLMRMPDAAFPGRYDKALWVATFLVVGPLAPIVFVLSGVRHMAGVDDTAGPEDEEEPAGDEPSQWNPPPANR